MFLSDAARAIHMTQSGHYKGAGGRLEIHTYGPRESLLLDKNTQAE